MAYHSVAEIYEAIDKARAQLLSSVEGLSDVQHSFRTAPDRWSIADVLEHLSLVEGQLARLFHVMIAKAEAAAAGEGAASFAPVSIEDSLAPLRTQKLQAPEGARPSGQVAPAEAVARLTESRASIRALRPRLEQVDGTAVRYPHPAAGPINIYQWLLFVGAHEDRHRAQIEDVKRSPGFKGDDVGKEGVGC